MANDRYRDYDTDRDYYGRSDTQDYGRDYGARTGSYSSARDYAATGQSGRNEDRGYGGNSGGGYGSRGREQGYGSTGYDQTGYGPGDDGRRNRDSGGAGSFGRDYDEGRERYGSSYGNRDYYGGQRPNRDQSRSGGRSDWGDRDYGTYGYGQDQYRSGQDQYRGSYASDGRRFAEGSTSAGESYATRRDSYGFGPQQRPGDRWNQDRGQERGGYGRQPQGYDYDDRGFFSRAGDEVRSWFGDDEAERRREADQRNDERYARQQGYHPDDNHYGSWRRGQIAALDRDYDEYRSENATKFENDFSTWRTDRQGQRDSLNKVAEHMDVVGSDGTHVGTVDKVRGDRIVLTKNDADAGGRHHSIPSRWIQTVADKKVTLRKTAEEAKNHWRDEERNSAFFNENGDERRGGSNDRSASTTGASTSASSTGTSSTGSASSSSTATPQGEGAHNLNKSFSGTY